MILSLFLFSLSASDSSLIASAATPLPGITVDLRGMVSDIDTSNFSFSNTPNVNSGPALNNIANIFLNTPRNDGRVWTDKSVNVGQAFIYDAAGSVVDTVRAPEYEFLVTLSALSQSIESESIIVEPSDTVFVIDASGSMATNTVPGSGIGGGPNRSRIAVVIDALNDAIGMLMKANSDNRVSVVIYGGQSVSGQNQAKVYPILSLGRYPTTQPIFSVSGTSVSVNTTIPAPLQRSFVVEGGTPTQLGMRSGADVLLGVPQGLDGWSPATPGGNGTWFNVEDPAVPGTVITTVTRKPNIILMTDGEPTYAWHDYTMSAFSGAPWQTSGGVTTTANWYDVGNGSAGDMGLTTLTVMTAAYVKQQVNDWYYPTNPVNPGYRPENAGKSVGFYTLGLGVNSAISNAMLSPYGTSVSGSQNANLVTQVYSGNTYNMLTELNNFAPGSTPRTFPGLDRGSGTARHPVTVTNTGGFIPTCNYDTMSFTAMDKAGLEDAFNTITQQIVTQGNYSTATSDNEQYDGYLVFSDVIGEYMEFGDFIGLWYDNVQNTGATFRSTVAADGANTNPMTTAYITNLTNFITKPNPTPGSPPIALTAPEATALISSSRTASGLFNGQNGNKVVYYADRERNWVSNYFSGGVQITEPADAYAKVELYTVDGPAVNALDGTTPANLQLIVFQVITILKDGDFVNYFSDATHLISQLKTGDQIVRWYIPAALIPLRSVSPVLDSGIPVKDDFGFDVIEVKEAAPLRVMYSVAPNFTKIAGGLTALYSDKNKSPSPNGYYFYSNRWRGMDGTVVRLPGPRDDLANMSQAFFVASDSNDFYNDQVLLDSTTLKLPNVTGPTGTSPWQWINTQFTHAPPTTPDTVVHIQRLGNNGRMEIQSQAELQIRKYFNFDSAAPWLAVENLSPISFLVVGYDNDIPPRSEIYRQIVMFNPGTWTETTPPRNSVYLSPVLNVPPGWYDIIEIGGQALNHIRPADTLHPPIHLPGLIPPPLVVERYNAYTHDYTADGLQIFKIFHGVFPDEIPPGFTMRITGPGGFDETYTLADLINLTTGDSIRIDISPALPGTYTVTETNYNIPGYDMTVDIDGNPRPVPIFTFVVGPEVMTEPIMIVIDDTYRKYLHELDLTKTVSGLSGLDVAGNPVVPIDLIFKIERTDPTGFLHTVRYEDMASGTYTLTDLLAGQYTITEIGGSVGEFEGPRVSYSITVNGAPASPNPNGTVANSYIFNISSTGDTLIEITFNNAYGPIPPPPTPPPETWEPPPPPGPSPQTGVETQSYYLPLMAITLGVLLIGGAEFYRRVFIEKRKSKNDKK